jgi:hypothetical protein
MKKPFGSVIAVAVLAASASGSRGRTERTSGVAGPMPPDDLMAAMSDSWGRAVWLTEERWRHIVAGHREVERHLEALEQCVQTAEKRSKGRYPGAEKLWVQNVGPSKWFCVVVRYEGRTGIIKTALPVRRGPRQGDLF